MATKKKSTSTGAATQKALARIEKAQKALQLNIKNLKTAMGHPHAAGRPKGHPHSATGAKGHPHSATARPKGHPHHAV
jgi:hypothetical protein